MDPKLLTHPMLVPSGMTLCQPQSIAYCTDGSRKLFEANFSMVSIPSSLTSALSSYNQKGNICNVFLHMLGVNCFLLYHNDSLWHQWRAVVYTHLFEETLPHLLYIQRLLFQRKLNYGGHKAGLRKGTLGTVFQPPILLDIGHSV